MELLGAAAFVCLFVCFVFVWLERRELRKHNDELKRELTRAIAQRDPWYEDESDLLPKVA